MRLRFAAVHESAVGTKRKLRDVRSETVVGGRADLTIATVDFRV
jgi:hypothetical protein